MIYMGGDLINEFKSRHDYFMICFKCSAMFWSLLQQAYEHVKVQVLLIICYTCHAYVNDLFSNPSSTQGAAVLEFPAKSS